MLNDKNIEQYKIQSVRTLTGSLNTAQLDIGWADKKQWSSFGKNNNLNYGWQKCFVILYAISFYSLFCSR